MEGPENRPLPVQPWHNRRLGRGMIIRWNLVIVVRTESCVWLWAAGLPVLSLGMFSKNFGLSLVSVANFTQRQIEVSVEIVLLTAQRPATHCGLPNLQKKLQPEQSRFFSPGLLRVGGLASCPRGCFSKQPLFFSDVFIFIGKADYREKEKNFPAVGSLSKWLQKPELSQLNNCSVP